jgi:hypothetical protein
LRSSHIEEVKDIKSKLDVERENHIKEVEEIKSQLKSKLDVKCENYIKEVEEIKSQLKSKLDVERENHIEEVEEIKLILTVERESKLAAEHQKHNKEVKEIKSKLKSELDVERENHIKEVKEIKSKHNASMRGALLVDSIKINHYGDNWVTPFSNDDNNSKSKSNKEGLNADEINELEHIMEVITTKQKKCLMDAGAKKEDVDVLFNLVGKGPLTTLMQSSYTTLGEIQSTYTTNVCMQTCHQTLDGESCDIRFFFAKLPVGAFGGYFPQNITVGSSFFFKSPFS